MKKNLCLFAAILTALQLSAADVTLSQAQAAANEFLTKQVKTGRLNASAATNLKLVKAEKSDVNPSAVDYYIFNSEKSYVVVAGDDLAPQILMYSEEASLDVNNIPPAMQWLLDKYKYQIDGLKAGTMVPRERSRFTTVEVPPVVTANWGQNEPFNQHCPYAGAGNNAVTGCCATSMGMCFYRWKWPKTISGLAALTGTGGIDADALPGLDVDWDNIVDEYAGPNSYTGDPNKRDAVAWLLRYVGQAFSTCYGANSSSAYDYNVYLSCRYFLGYENVEQLAYSQVKNDDRWNEYMMNELQNGRPIEYFAQSTGGSSHAFNVFGCNSSGQYYVNWGWTGLGNGYCTLHRFAYTQGSTTYSYNFAERMIIGIEPPADAHTGPRLKVNPTTILMNTTVGKPATATFTVTGYDLTDDVALTLRGDNAFSLSTSSISASQAENEATVTVTFNPSQVGRHEGTITLTTTDAFKVTVKLNGIADLETSDPVMLDATDITSTSFTANWTDETPAENVQSYTLLVSDQPVMPVARIGFVDWSASCDLPTDGWTSYGVWFQPGNHGCYLHSSYGFVKSPTYDLTGYDKVTVMVYADLYTSNTITVATSVDSKTVSKTKGSSDFSWYTIVLDCASSDYIKLTSKGGPYIQYMKVYAGDPTSMMQLEPSETGDETYRVITGITDKSCTVTGLTECGTFNFYVVTNYTDDGIGNSNINQITLFDLQPGDVNHDGKVSIADATALIDYLLGFTDEAYIDCADVNVDNKIDIADVMAIIDMILGANR